MKLRTLILGAFVAVLASCSQYKYETVANDPMKTKMIIRFMIIGD